VAFFTMSWRDFLFLGIVMRRAWMRQIMAVQGGEPPAPRLGATLFTYATMLACVMALAVPRVREDFVVPEAIGYGALTGFLVFSVYDGTSRAIYRNYGLGMACIDTIWGTFLFSVTCLTASLAAEHWHWVI
jgi:uncharacterized membrane protein